MEVTYNPTDPNAPEFTADELDSLRVGEEQAQGELAAFNKDPHIQDILSNQAHPQYNEMRARRLALMATAEGVAIDADKVFGG